MGPNGCLQLVTDHHAWALGGRATHEQHDACTSVWECALYDKKYVVLRKQRVQIFHIHILTCMWVTMLFKSPCNCFFFFFFFFYLGGGGIWGSEIIQMSKTICYIHGLHYLICPLFIMFISHSHYCYNTKFTWICRHICCAVITKATFRNCTIGSYV